MARHFNLRAFAAAWLCALALAGCTHTHVTQGRGEVLVRSGDYDNFNDRREPRAAGPVAARVVPYALLAELPYRDDGYVKPKGGRLLELKRDCPEGELCPTLAADQIRARRFVRQWRYLWGCNNPVDCLQDKARAQKAVGGLGVQIYLRRGEVCREAVIAFRGTDRGDQGDWVSNLHWVTRALPVDDQYDQVRDRIGAYVAMIRDQDCYRKGTTKIVALGHSLGGGLAQLASHANAKVGRVYAFDPSFVTGYYSGGIVDRDGNVKGHQIERVYEHGEILAYLRYILRQAAPPSPCNPRIVNVRFDLLQGSVIDQHSLADFTTGLLRASNGVPPEPHPVVDRQDCPVKDSAAVALR